MSFFVIASCVSNFNAQTPEPTQTPQLQSVEDKGTVKVRVDLVTLTLTVTDIYGRYVSGLGKNAFRLRQQRRARDHLFPAIPDAPVSSAFCSTFPTR
ncbi:MAG: hypothetical protein IPJ30_13780 [Acidobacteria bacterium]|nr:hypothetical protein [Acidobacteriota bacterium]